MSAVIRPRPVGAGSVTPMTGPFDRATALRRLADEQFDLLVIGGGITGAGVALDAASRGLRTALVERDDFASGTSSKSSKMVHGGLRYLQNGDVRLVYEALAERQRLRRNAPHLVKILPFLIPIFSKDGLINPKVARALGSAMWMYDVTGGARIGKLHKRLKPAEALEYMPTLPAERLAGAYLYYDARADDARLTLTIARTAALDFDAVVANGCRVTQLLKDGSDGRVAGATIDAGGNAFDVRAEGRGQRDRRVGGRRARARRRHASRTRCGRRRASTSPCRGRRCATRSRSSRPCRRTSGRCSSSRGPTTRVSRSSRTSARPTPTTKAASTIRSAIATTSSTCSRAINGSVTTKLTDDDVLGTWAGLRPLVKSASSGRTADLSRRHRVARSASGLVTITGGKLTTYREMAADTVDEVMRGLGDARRRSRHPPPAAAGRRRLRDARDRAPRPQATTRCSTCSTGTATRRPPCSRSPNATRRWRSRSSPDSPTCGPRRCTPPATRWPASVDDVLSRRTRARLLARDETAAIAADVAALLAPELGWDEAERAAQAAAYRAGVDHERTVPHLPETALEAALGT